jgi:hypothetical protein
MVRKSRIESLRAQQEEIQEKLKEALVKESTKNRKLETQDKILLGVMFQGLIADGSISTQMFEGAMEKYLKYDGHRERCDAYFDAHRPRSQEVESEIEEVAATDSYQHSDLADVEGG